MQGKIEEKNIVETANRYSLFRTSVNKIQIPLTEEVNRRQVWERKKQNTFFSASERNTRFNKNKNYHDLL